MTSAAATLIPAVPGAPAPAAPGAAALAPAPAAAPAAASNDYAWLGENPDAETIGFVQNKGWKGARDVVDSARNLEKLVGRNRLAAPKDENDTEALNAIYTALGRPATPADYKLPLPYEADPKFAEAASNTFHKLGLTTKQGQELAAWWNQETQARAQAEQEAAIVQGKADMDGLQTKWGSAYDAKIEAGRRAARTFGINGETAGKLEKALGTGGLLELMSRFGEALTEHGMSGIDTTGETLSLGMTPEQAKEEITRLRNDPQWSKALSGGDAEKRKRWDALHKAAFPS